MGSKNSLKQKREKVLTCVLKNGKVQKAEHLLVPLDMYITIQNICEEESIPGHRVYQGEYLNQVLMRVPRIVEMREKVRRKMRNEDGFEFAS